MHTVEWLFEEMQYTMTAQEAAEVRSQVARLVEEAEALEEQREGKSRGEKSKLTRAANKKRKKVEELREGLKSAPPPEMPAIFYIESIIEKLIGVVDANTEIQEEVKAKVSSGQILQVLEWNADRVVISANKARRARVDLLRFHKWLNTGALRYGWNNEVTEGDDKPGHELSDYVKLQRLARILLDSERNAGRELLRGRTHTEFSSSPWANAIKRGEGEATAKWYDFLEWALVDLKRNLERARTHEELHGEQHEFDSILLDCAIEGFSE